MTEKMTHELMLGQALLKVLVKCCVLGQDAQPTGPELLLAAEDFCSKTTDKGVKQ